MYEATQGARPFNTLLMGIGIPHDFKIHGLSVRLRGGVPTYAAMTGIGIPGEFKIR